MARKPKTDLEREFHELFEKRGAQVQAAFKKAELLSEKYGIPYGTFIPKSFRKKLRDSSVYDTDFPDTQEGTAAYYAAFDEIEDFVDYVGKVANVDKNFWCSSTTECEIFR